MNSLLSSKASDLVCQFVRLLIFTTYNRHSARLSLRMCANIQRSRAAVSRRTLCAYFENIKKELDGLPSSNVVNFDETNLQDDPGRSKAITKRGCKYPERVIDTSKSAHSLMYAAAADGTVLPAYVVYKAKHL
ncbi:Hypothetical protein NTJ_04533 [Nesidiocoris tenuis]|uniref:DDE-1 domain-containing protein n=1 Tax=Nesidiocoris tenuis TaxID=355587 RepID=A0ABN7ALE9_9HEMI|nr:Hypothetical protein NTJ_04533 [Nesidiocoris tenuis]